MATINQVDGSRSAGRPVRSLGGSLPANGSGCTVSDVGRAGRHADKPGEAVPRDAVEVPVTAEYPEGNEG